MPSYEQFGYNDHMYSNNGLYGLYGNVIDSGHAYGTFGYDSWKLGRGWYPVDGYKKTKSFNYGRGYSEEKADRLNELCRGPRSSEGLNSTVKQDSPVVENFPETLVNAKFFVIKSYSEDDVHNSIKYGMWSSTPTGNKKLNAAYQESSQDCSVYLLFSVSMSRLFIQCSCGFSDSLLIGFVVLQVNASGQFVGVAEMIGAVDFNKTMEYWQQDKWIGCFPVKWRIIKDVPNSLLRHITLVNNENKPVTNSRDTQEVCY